MNTDKRRYLRGIAYGLAAFLVATGIGLPLLNVTKPYVAALPSCLLYFVIAAFIAQEKGRLPGLWGFLCCQGLFADAIMAFRWHQPLLVKVFPLWIFLPIVLLLLPYTAERRRTLQGEAATPKPRTDRNAREELLGGGIASILWLLVGLLLASAGDLAVTL